jgi:PAS domain S-box-containing protein
MRIASKIILSIVICFAVAVVAIDFFIGSYSVNMIKERIYSYLQTSNKARAEHIRTFLQNQKESSEMLAAASVYRDFLNDVEDSTIREKIYQRFNRTLALDPHMLEIYILSKDGKVLASSDKEENGEDRSNDDYFVKGKNSTYIKSLYFYGSYEKIVYSVSSPILDDSGLLLGVSVLVFSPDNFYEIVKNENGLGKTEENFLINKDKYFLTPSIFLGKDVILKQKVETKNANDCFQQDEADYVTKNGYTGLVHPHENIFIGTKDYRGVDVIGTHAYIPETGWCLITKIDKSIVDKDIINITIINAFISGIIFIILIAIVYILIKKNASGIKKLEESINEVEHGNLNVKISMNRQDEIGMLSRAFAKMIESVKNSRQDVDKQVDSQTQEIKKNQEYLENQQKAVLNILEDIQEEKSKTELLAKDLEKFKMAVENASDHIIITDAEGTVLYANRAAEKITGFSKEEMMNKKAALLWKLPMPNDYYEEMWDVIKNKKQVFAGEIKNKRKNGEVYTAEVSISPVLDGDNNILYFVGIEHDISDQKEAEEQVRQVLNNLQEESQKLSIAKSKDDAILNGIGDGIIVTDQDGNIVSINNATVEMLGVIRDELIGKSVTHVLKMVDDKDKEVPIQKRPMVQALSTGNKIINKPGETFYYLRKDGTKFPAGITVTPFVLDGRIVGVIEVLRNITLEKEIDKAKTEFVSLASHQLRTPLSTVGWYTEMLLSGDAGKINKKQKEFLDEVYKGNRRMVELVNSLLNVSRIELGTFAVDPVPSDIKEIAETVFDELVPQIKLKKLKIVKKYAKLGKINLDPKLIRIVFQNLLTNAIKYTQEKGLVELSVEKKNGKIQVSVKDNGYGIPENAKQKIFTKLFRADNVKSKDSGGTGLGLYIIKSIVAQSGGEIWFESEENKGTTFFFTIPEGGMQTKTGSKPLS